MHIFLIAIFFLTSFRAILAKKVEYEAQSIACQKFKQSIIAEKLCEDSLFFFWTVFCRYKCNSNGDLSIKDCETDNSGLKEYPLCDDLYCVRKTDAPKSTPKPNTTAVVYYPIPENITTNEWSSQCWKKHNSGSIQTPDGEFKRPFGILCTYQCFLWFQPVFPYCEFIFDLRMSRHFTILPDCYEIHCNETFTFFNDPK